MECVTTTENSELKVKQEGNGKTGESTISTKEPKEGGDSKNVTRVEKKEEEVEKPPQNQTEQSDHENVVRDDDVENILGLVGKYLYRQRNRKGKRRRMPIARRVRKINACKRRSNDKRTTAKRTITKRTMSKRSTHDGVGQVNHRNWRRLSIYPIINFMRDFRKTLSRECPPETMAMKANEIWLQMPREERLPFIIRAERAINNGYLD